MGLLLAGIALLTAHQPFSACAETEIIDLKALAKKARPAVMLLVVSDANGKEIATGTGFLVSSDGKLITNFHVIEKAVSAVAKAENGGLFPVEGVLASDPKNDLVLLKLRAKDQPFLSLGDSEKAEAGTRIAVIGSPLGLEGTLSEGIVSAKRELMGGIRRLQITAAISSGSSGSPVMDAKGDVIGVAAASRRGGQALNFAVPVEFAEVLLGKTNSTKPLQSLAQISVVGEDKFYMDADWGAMVAAVEAKDYVEALKHGKVLITRYPDSAMAYSALALAYYCLKFTDDAIAAGKRAVTLNPNLADAWIGLGMSYGQCKRTAEEIAAYHQVIKLKPDDAEAWSSLGGAYGRCGRTTDGIAACQQAIKLKPNFADAWCTLGFVYVEARRAGEATVSLQRAIALKPDYAAAWRFLGDAYSDSGRTGDAITAYQKAVKFDPDYAEGWNNLGIAYGKSNRTTDAISAFQQALKLQPDAGAIWRNLGFAYRQGRRMVEAEDAFRRAQELNPGGSTK